MFMAVSFTIAKTCKQPNALTDAFKKTPCVHTMEYYSVFKKVKKKNSDTWMSLEDIMLSDLSQ